jgi:hypothetical protein
MLWDRGKGIDGNVVIASEFLRQGVGIKSCDATWNSWPRRNAGSMSYWVQPLKTGTLRLPTANARYVAYRGQWKTMEQRNGQPLYSQRAAFATGVLLPPYRP